MYIKQGRFIFFVKKSKAHIFGLIKSHKNEIQFCIKLCKSVFDINVHTLDI